MSQKKKIFPFVVGIIEKKFQGDDCVKYSVLELYGFISFAYAQNK